MTLSERPTRHFGPGLTPPHPPPRLMHLIRYRTLSFCTRLTHRYLPFSYAAPIQIPASGLIKGRHQRPLLPLLVGVLATLARPIDDQPSKRAVVCPSVSRIVHFLSLGVFSPSQIGSCPIITLSMIASRLANSPSLVVVTFSFSPCAFSDLRGRILGSPFLLSFLTRTHVRRHLQWRTFVLDAHYERGWGCNAEVGGTAR